MPIDRDRRRSDLGLPHASDRHGAPGKATITARMPVSRQVVQRAASPAAAAVTPHDPAEAFGVHLVAHELAVSTPGDAAEVEAERAADAMVAGAPAAVSGSASGLARVEDPADWDGNYKRTETSVPVTQFHDPAHNNPSDYDTFKDKQIGTGSGKNRVAGVSAASSHGGTKVPDGFEVSREDLVQIFLALDGDDAHKDQIIDYCHHLSTAFRVMQIDTVEAMAMYLAHAASESDQFRKMTETQRDDQRFEDDPAAVKLNTTYLTEQYMTKRDESGKVVANEEKGAGMTVNPPDATTHERDWSFIGRGPVQTTHRDGYVRSLAYLEKRAEQMATQRAALEAGLTDGIPTTEIEQLAEDELLCRDALTALKADPKQAANPRYAFLFAAATMHMSRGVENSGQVAAQKPENLSFDGKGLESTWVTGGKAQNQPKADGSPPDIDSAKIKKDAYGRAVSVLGAKAKAMAPPATATTTAP